MLKYMITTKCPRSCSYCITRNVKSVESTSKEDFSVRFWQLWLKGVREVMITGGEPTMAIAFEWKLNYLRFIGFRRHLTTQNPKALLGRYDKYFTTITFSRHGVDLLKLPRVKSKVPVYLSIIPDFEWYPEIAREARELGFSGLSINEEQRNGKPFNEKLPSLKNFSYKINRKGHCVENELILLPDLELKKSFKEYL